MNHFSQHKNQELTLFRYLLEEVINGKNKEFKADLNSVLDDTHMLVAGKKNYFQVNRDYYSLIVFLSKIDRSYFMKPKKRPNVKTYKHVKVLLSKDNAVHAFA